MGEVSSYKIKPILEEFKAFFPLVIVSIYTIGYSYLSLFYGSFGIQFEYYTSLLDIVFFTIKHLLFIVFLYWAVDAWLYGLYILYSKIFLEKRILSLNKFRSSERLKRYLALKRKKYKFEFEDKLLFIFVLFLLLQLITSALDYTFLGYPTMGELFPVIVGRYFYLGILRAKYRKKKNYDTPVELEVFFSYIFFTIICVFSSSIQGSVDAKRIIKGDISGKNLSITIENESLDTKDDDFTYIGESSDYLFLFDYKSKKSMVINKSKVPFINFYTE